MRPQPSAGGPDATPPGLAGRPAGERAATVPAVPPEDIDRLVTARHGAPHAVLGPHFAADRSAVAIRALLPYAAEAAVVVDGEGGRERPMRRIHADGLFEIVIAAPAADFAYELSVVEPDGRRRRLADGYGVLFDWFSVDDARLFAAGRHVRLYEKLGAHPLERDGVRGVVFAVWAPAAERVSVVGAFNRWDGRCHPMRRLAGGVWELFVPGVESGTLYKYEIRTGAGAVFLKTDPFAFETEVAPRTAAVVSACGRDFRWHDDAWLRARREVPPAERLVCVHGLDLAAVTPEAGSNPPAGGERAIEGGTVATDIARRGFTHVELSSSAPVFGGAAGAFAAGPACGAPAELMALIDACHRRGLGVVVPICRWRFAEAFPELAWFDGTPLFEGDAEGAAAGRFDHARGEVRSFLLSNALFWIERYHVDGLRTDRRTALVLRALAALAGEAFAGATVVVREPAAGDRVPSAAIERLRAACHDDPYTLLGPHADKDGAATTLRVLLPRAEQVAARFDDEPHVVYEFERLHADGLFATTLAAAGADRRYRLQVHEAGGRTAIIDDAYALPAFAFSALDQHLFGAGNHYRIHEKLGAHPRRVDGIAGTGFAVWAPNAEGVSVVGPFNDWDGRCHAMRRHDLSGVWEIFVPGVGAGALYKFEIRSRAGHAFLKSDPYAFLSEVPPATANIVYDPSDGYAWGDREWMQRRATANPWRQPIAIYEVHFGSWRRDGADRPVGYREMAATLIPYVKQMGFTHIELLPIAEHPYEPSWGYQVSSFYAPTSRFGTPADLKAFVDACHREGIGVILDWVPGHFPKDAHALAWFDGTHLYEHADPRKGEHPDWGTLIFNYGRHEVENFLIANALFWLEVFHFDGLRVDAVASMLYLDYSRPGSGEWIPNMFGGRENLEAIEFLKHTNAVVYERFPGVLMIAEESTAWPNVSRPTHLGGLGFGFKWNMGWMHDVLAYMSTPPAERMRHHHKLTFGITYAFHENFILSLSHDEVVHMKGSLYAKMPGGAAEKLANLRLLFTFLYAHPGKKLLFMGAELGQRGEWDHAASLEWPLLDGEPHRRLNALVRDLNRIYRDEPALFEVDFRSAGFEWLDVDDAERSIIAFVRKARDPRDALVVVLNFSEISRPWYRLGVPYPVAHRAIFDSNDRRYGGCGSPLAAAAVGIDEIPCGGHEFSLSLPMPALSAVILRPAAPDLVRGTA